MPTAPVTADAIAPPRARSVSSRPTHGGRWWVVAAGLLACIVALPIIAVLANALRPRPDIWAHLLSTRLTSFLGATFALLLAVGTLVLIVGVGLGWLVATHRFPGRGFFQWALVLPLAMPAYVIGFAFVSAFDYGGPIATFARASLGSAAWLPEPRSFGALAIVMALVQYPYVYLTSRAAFHDRSTHYVDAARSLGLGPWSAFVRLALPLARPGIAAGLALALMETLADFGTVSIFNHDTLTIGVYRVWFGMFDRVAAGQLATLLLLFAAALLALDRWGRRGARFSSASASPIVAPRELRGTSRWLATAACCLVFALAFVLPTVILLGWSWQGIGDADVMRRFVSQARNSVIAASMATVLCLAAAMILGYGARLTRRRLLDRLSHVALLGYAVPGSVIAVGVLVVLSQVDRVAERAAGALSVAAPSLFVASVTGLLFAYVVRFMAVAYLPVRAGLDRISPAIDESARVLGASPWRQAVAIHGPLMRMALLTAALLVFVDVMKEMPATMLIRPLGFDTLAVGVWQATTESLWTYAGPPSLAMVLVSVVALFVASRVVRRQRMSLRLTGE